MDGLSLDAIGLEQGTDKASSHHDYLRVYERFFQPLRGRPLTLLEIGVLGGASLRTWEAYFPDARIIGADIDLLARRHRRGRVEVEIMDQANLDDLVRVASRHGPFDIVIDDGSHLWDDQILTLKTLFPYLKSGGVYAVEDLQTNYGAFAANYQAGAKQSCVEFLKTWLDQHVADDPASTRLHEDPFIRSYGRAAAAFHFQPRLCLIEKRGVARPPGMILPGPLNLSPPTVPTPRVGVLAHCSYAGEIYGPEGYIDLGFDRFALQGFAVDAPDNDLEYRVRGPDGVWSEWIGAPGFAGTRGQALELTGVAVRSRPEREARRLRVTARFAHRPDIVEVRQGEDCVARGGVVSPLVALQIEYWADPQA